jgi:hypothetical protein
MGPADRIATAPRRLTVGPFHRAAVVGPGRMGSPIALARAFDLHRAGGVVPACPMDAAALERCGFGDDDLAMLAGRSAGRP